MNVAAKKNVRRWGALEKRLAAYAVAGGAVLAAASEANADPIYSGVQNIPLVPGGPGVPVDLNSDGLVDFTFGAAGSPGSNSFSLVQGNTGDGLASTFFGGTPVIDNLPPGTTVDSGLNYQSPSFLSIVNVKVTGTFGNFIGTTGFMGVEFQDLSSQNHFGWIRFTGNSNDAGGTIVDWAYESTPNTPIVTGIPEPSSFVLLTLGATGLAVWRWRKARASRPAAEQHPTRT